MASTGVNMAWTDVVSALGAGLEALVVGGALIYARGQFKEARTLREQQTRPFVVVDLDTQSHPPIIGLSVANIGQTVARNVRVVFEPPLRTTFYPDQAWPPSSLFSKGIPTLPPNKKIETLLDNGPDRFQAKLDDAYTAVVTYGGDGEATYLDTYILDIGMFYGLEYIPLRGLSDIHKELRQIRAEVEKWRGPAQRGLLIKTTMDEAEHQDEIRELRDARRAARKQVEDPERVDEPNDRPEGE